MLLLIMILVPLPVGRGLPCDRITAEFKGGMIFIPPLFFAHLPPLFMNSRDPCLTIQPLFLKLALVALVLGVYYPVIFAPFNSVDDCKMANCLLNFEWHGFGEIFFPGSRSQYYRPLLQITFIADKYLWGIEESFMHLENILIHLFNVILVFHIANNLLKESQDQRLAAFAAAFLFAFHPIVTEAVNWVAGRADLLAGCGVLTSLLCLIRYCDRPSFLFGCGAIAAFTLGCFAKETALFLLPAILLVLFYPRWGFPVLRRFQSYGLATAFVCAAIAYFIIRKFALSGGDKGVATVGVKVIGEPQLFWDKIRIIVKVIGFYLKKLFIPFPLNFGIVEISNMYAVVGVLMLMILVYWLFTQNTASWLGLVTFSLSASALMVPMLRITWTPVAERYMYIPSATFAVGLVIASTRIEGQRCRQGATWIYLLVMIVFVSGTFQRNLIWQDNLTLFQDTVKKSPSFEVAKNDLAMALRKHGQITEANAILKNLEISKFQPSSLNPIKVLMCEGNLTEARRLIIERIKEPSEYRKDTWDLLVTVDELRRQKNCPGKSCREVDEQILNSLRELYNISGDPFYQYRIGYVLLRLGKRGEARKAFEISFHRAPITAVYRDAAGKLSKSLAK